MAVSKINVPTSGALQVAGVDAVTWDGNGLVGRGGGVAPHAGNVGELISSAISQASAVSLTSGVAVNITSISLTSGTWEISGVSAFVAGATTSVNYQVMGSSASSATFDVVGSYSQMQFVASPVIGVTPVVISLPNRRIEISTTTTIYLVAQGGFTISTLSAFGVLRAVRII